MNSFEAKLVKIENLESLNIVHFRINNQNLSMMSLELNSSLEVDKNVKLLAKPTHIAIAKNFEGEISYSNQLKAKIEKMDKGELLVSVYARMEGFLLESIITRNSCEKMNLTVDDDVTLFIKASELSVIEVCDD